MIMAYIFMKKQRAFYEIISKHDAIIADKG